MEGQVEEEKRLDACKVHVEDREFIEVLDVGFWGD